LRKKSKGGKKKLWKQRGEEPSNTDHQTKPGGNIKKESTKKPNEEENERKKVGEQKMLEFNVKEMLIPHRPAKGKRLTQKNKTKFAKKPGEEVERHRAMIRRIRDTTVVLEPLELTRK